MNVFEVDICRAIKHDSVFSHNVVRQVLVHAMNKEQAAKKVVLAKASTWDSGHSEVSAEFIYSIRKTGTVTKQMYYVYSDGRDPRPVNQGKR